MDNIILAALAIPYRKTANNLEFLLLKHENGTWTFPGGAMEKTDSSLEDCLLRELNEELGLVLSKKNFVDTELINNYYI